MTQMTVEQAFVVAIEVERLTEQLYQGLSAKFAHHADVAEFWNIFAIDEAKHGEWLVKTHSRLTAEQLGDYVNEETQAQLISARRFSVEKALQSVHNLEDAYILVVDIENGETNAIFKFLLDNFEPDGRTREFLVRQINQHIASLSLNLPTDYKGIITRKAMLALD
jgi:hypothetical protein